MVRWDTRRHSVNRSVQYLRSYSELQRPTTQLNVYKITPWKKISCLILADCMTLGKPRWPDTWNIPAVQRVHELTRLLEERKQTYKINYKGKDVKKSQATATKTNEWNIIQLSTATNTLHKFLVQEAVIMKKKRSQTDIPNRVNFIYFNIKGASDYKKQTNLNTTNYNQRGYQHLRCEILFRLAIRTLQLKSAASLALHWT